MKLRVVLNGTDVNPFHKMGLRCNPFPQIAKAEYEAACIRMQELGGDPIPKDRPHEYIRERLDGFDPEFVELCCKSYRPGEMVRFMVEFEE